MSDAVKLVIVVGMRMGNFIFEDKTV